MYETISENLTLILYFIIIGFFLSLFYEAFRILRVLIKHSVLIICIEDFLYLTLCGLITFAYSMEFGTGDFRFHFAFAELLGFLLYSVTIGAMIKPFYSIIAKIIAWFYRKIRQIILQPLYHFINKLSRFLKSKFVHTHNFVIKNTKSTLISLKNRCQMLYNKPNVETKNETDGKQHVIKAEIRKKA